MVFCCIVLLYTLALRFGGLIVYHAFHGDDSLPCGLSFIMPRIQWTIVPQRIILHPSGIHCICKVNKISSISLHLRRKMVDMAVKNTCPTPQIPPSSTNKGLQPRIQLVHNANRKDQYPLLDIGLILHQYVIKFEKFETSQFHLFY